MTFAGYGRDPWGLSPWGASALGDGIHLVSAVALSTREVQVTLSGLALAEAQTAPGDALNPATWVLQRLDTMEYLNVVAVRPASPTAYILTTVQEFGAADVTHRVSSTTLLDPSGILLAPPRAADYLGILAADKATQDAMIARRQAISRDIANPQLPPPGGLLAGTLIVNAAGDYEMEAGTPLVKKLILRRLTSSPGDFFHLPEYGIGFKVKDPVPSSDLVKLRAAVELQVRREPEVQDVAATLYLQPGNVLYIQLKARLRTGDVIDVGLPAPTLVVL